MTDLCYCETAHQAEEVANRVRSLGCPATVDARKVACWTHYYIMVATVQAGDIACAMGYQPEPIEY